MDAFFVYGWFGESLQNTDKRFWPEYNGDKLKRNRTNRPLFPKNGNYLIS